MVVVEAPKVSTDTHLHWRQTGKATWHLHLAHVRHSPAHYDGACRLTTFHANVRVLVNGRVRWSIDNEQPRDTPHHAPPEVVRYELWRLPLRVVKTSPVGHPVIEEAFMAALAARALRGTHERLSQNSVQEVCAACPPKVQVRIDRVRRERRALQVWTDWDNTIAVFRVKRIEELVAGGFGTNHAHTLAAKEWPYT